MTEKRWDAKNRKWIYIATGIVVDGIDYDAAGAYAKWVSRAGETKCRKAMAQGIIKDMIAEERIFDKHHNWLNEMERKIVAYNADMVDRAKGKVQRGGNGLIALAQIPQQFQAGIKAIASAPGHHPAYDRGNHRTNPAHQTGGFGQFREFHLTPQTDGRAVTAIYKGERFVYYSTTHAAATYNYQLVTFPFTLPGQPPVQVPLSGGTRDDLIVRPA